MIFGRMANQLKKLALDLKGSITIEFMLWAPVLIFWLVGTIVFFDAFKTRGNLNAANSTIADISSRNSELSPNYMALLQLLQNSLLPRTRGSGLRISSILFTIDPNVPGDPGTYTVEWSAVAGATVDVLIDNTIDIAKLPDMYSSESVLYVESTVPFVPLTTFIGVPLKTLRSAVAISPRYDSRIVWIVP